MVGYDKPDFWTKELFNIITFKNGFGYVNDLYKHTSAAALAISGFSFAVLFGWKKYLWKKIPFIPASFVTVLTGALLAWVFNNNVTRLQLEPQQFVSVPPDLFSQVRLTGFADVFSSIEIWRYAVVICFVAVLETLLSIEAIDKLDPYNRITPQNRELIAQGTGNFVSGLVGGLPITAVIVRSSANAEAGARTRLSSLSHGVWLLLAVLLAVPFINRVPYCVLAVILARTGYNLAKPRMIKAVLKQGREQFIPFIVTVLAILFTDLLIGVLIGIVFAIYFLMKHTYRAGFTIKETAEGHIKHFTIELALNVSFLNKKRFIDMLDALPEYSVVKVNGSKSVYIDRDILEIFHDFKSKAHYKHIQLTLIAIPDVETIELH
jgi:MFS superfamily sulfate permease-like transporter